MPGALAGCLPRHAPLHVCRDCDYDCDVPGAALFDLCNVELEQVVQPGDEFLSTQTPQSASASAQRGGG
jgi:hypothetical protein